MVKLISFTLLLVAAILWSKPVEAHHIAPINFGSVYVRKCAPSDPTCNINSTTGLIPSPQIKITGTEKTVHWKVVFDNPLKTSDIWLSINKPNAQSQDIKIPLNTALVKNTVTGEYSGDFKLGSGTTPGGPIKSIDYYIAVNLISMAFGAYTIDYNTSSTGDPHITTINGIRYDFQAAGEFILLRQTNNLEIQVRQSPYPTNGAACVSINTAIAAKVGNHRVTYEPNLNGKPDPGGLQLRIDGNLTNLGNQEIDLGNGARIVRTNGTGALLIEFEDGTYLFVTPGWLATQGMWVLDLRIAPANDNGQGIIGAIGADTWLPLLPDGSSLGRQPNDPHDRYVALYQKFADAWRVTDANSLFDYAPETSTKTFTNQNWPSEFPPCLIPGTTPDVPIPENIARAICQIVQGSENEYCVYDVMVTGNPDFAKIYAEGQKIFANAVNQKVDDSKNHGIPQSWIYFLLGLFLGFLLACLIYFLWRKRTAP